MDNNLITKLFARINDVIDYKLKYQTQIKSATIHSVNQDETVNIIIPPGNTVYHNVQNQSIYRNLLPGDNVKIIVENGNLSNMWIIGRFNVNKNGNNASGPIIDIDYIYPIGSIYMSVNSVNPSILFGGTWEQLKDRFLLGAGDSYAAGETDGEATHRLTTEEMPTHAHGIKQYTTSTSGIAGVTKAIASDSIVDADYTWRASAVAPSGGSAAHNNMPPYLAVYMWKRVE